MSDYNRADLYESDEGKTVEISVEVKHETDLAYLIFDGTKKVWVPKSLIHDIEENNNEEITSMYIEEWWATKEGLI